MTLGNLYKGDAELPPFLVILIVNTVLVSIAYGVVYPRLRPLTVRRMVATDLVLTTTALTIAGFLYAGQGLPFQVGPVPLHWWGASFLSLFALEIPLFVLFSRIYGISFDDSAPGDRD